MSNNERSFDNVKKHIHREITPLKENDCFMIFDRKRNSFTFPIHFHPEYELNFILNAKGGRRYIGDHIGEIENKELVLVGPNIYHGWENYHNDVNEELHEITIQFSQDVFSEELLSKNVLRPIKDLLDSSRRGIRFSQETIKSVEPILIRLSKRGGFDSYMDLQSLLYQLSNSQDNEILTNIAFSDSLNSNNSQRMEEIFKYVKLNYENKIKLPEVADHVGMSVISISRLVKSSTGKSFVDFINDFRLGIATRWLIETNKNITEIGFQCGFNNLSNFNRIFKKRQGLTPSEFRNNFHGTKSIV